MGHCRVVEKEALSSSLLKKMTTAVGILRLVFERNIFLSIKKIMCVHILEWHNLATINILSLNPHLSGSPSDMDRTIVHQTGIMIPRHSFKLLL